MVIYVSNRATGRKYMINNFFVKTQFLEGPISRSMIEFLQKPNRESTTIKKAFRPEPERRNPVLNRRVRK